MPLAYSCRYTPGDAPLPRPAVCGLRGSAASCALDRIGGATFWLLMIRRLVFASEYLAHIVGRLCDGLGLGMGRPLVRARGGVVWCGVVGA